MSNIAVYRCAALKKLHEAPRDVIVHPMAQIIHFRDITKKVGPKK